MSSRNQRVRELFFRAIDADCEDGGAMDSTPDSLEDVGLRDEVRRLLASESERCAVDVDLFGEAWQALCRSLGSDSILGSLPEPTLLTESSRLGPYQLVREVGWGAMGRVFEARRADGQFEQKVAIKLGNWLTQDEEAMARLEKEKVFLAGLDHQNIVRLLDGGTTESGLSYFVMEYVEGVPIDQYAEDYDLSVRSRLDLFLKVCSAVDYAHQRLLVHCDLKPSNLLVVHRGSSGGGPIPKILDFGIAKLLGAERSARPLTRDPERRPLTPEYASPEQVRGEEPTTSFDIYALGILLYELVTGERPYEFQERSRSQVLEVHARKAMRSPREVRPELDADLEAIVLAATEPSPGDRYSSVGSLIRDVERYLSCRPVTARRPSWLHALRKSTWRNRKWVSIGIGFIAIVIGGMGMTLWQAQEAREARRVSENRLRQVESLSAFQGEVTSRVDARRLGEISVELLRGAILETRFSSTDSELPSSIGMEDSIPNVLEACLSRVSPGELGRAILHEGVLAPASKAIEEEFPDDEVTRARLRHALGITYWKTGDYERARTELDRSLELHFHGVEDLESLTLVSDLAAVCFEQGRFDEAYDLLAPRLPGFLKIAGPNDEAFLNAKNNLALVQRSRGCLEEAEALAREVLEVRQEVSGPRNPATLRALNNLALISSDRGRREEPEALFLEGIEAQGEVLGVDHPDTLSAKGNLAAIYQEWGHLAKAKVLLREVVESRARVLGPEHPTTLLATSNFAALLYRTGEFDAAMPLAEETLAKQRRLLGERHPETLATVNHLASLYRSTNQEARAESAWLRLLEIPEQTSFQPGGGAVLVARHNLASMYLRQERYSEAEALFAEVVQRFRRLGRVSSVPFGEALKGHGFSLCWLGRYSESEAAFLGAREVFREVFGEKHVKTVGVQETLNGLYRIWGREQGDGD